MITQGVQGVYPIGEWMLNKMRNGEPFFFGQIMERMANEYGIPSIDLGVEAIKQLEADDLIFKGMMPVDVETDDIYTRDKRRSNDMLRGAVKTGKVGETLEIEWKGSLI